MYKKVDKLLRPGVEESKKLIAAFDTMTKNPMAVQKKLLMDLLAENKDTEYGKNTALVI